MSIEITFNSAGNTIVGNYSTYSKLDQAISSKKHIQFPQGLTIKGEQSDILRLADHVLTFGNCLKTISAWKHACKLSDVEVISAREIAPV